MATSNRLSASAAVKRMADKRLKARDLVEACLDRIDAREGQVHAWEALDPEGARKRADMLDKRSRPVGPLHGIPLAIKDIIDTRTMPTTCGSPIYRDHVAGRDAACVTQLVKAGAIAAVPMLLVLRQPDLGTALTYVPIAVMALFLDAT